MNSDKHRPVATRGNALVYILLALALLAGLTMVLSRSASTGGDDLSADKVELLTTKIVAYTGTAKNAVDQMLMSGSLLANIGYLRPQDAGFNSASSYNQVFHPQGGGLTSEVSDPAIFPAGDDNPEPGWYMGRFNNVEWTPTTANDVLFVAYGINEPICQSLNKKITGNTDIPVVSEPIEELFVDTAAYGGGGWTNADLTTTNCPDCEGWPSLCVTDGQYFLYYNIISGQ